MGCFIIVLFLDFSTALQMVLPYHFIIAVLFVQAIRKRFGKTFGLKATSLLKGVVKEMKVKPKTALSGVQKLKMKDVIAEALTDLNGGVGKAGRTKQGL